MESSSSLTASQPVYSTAKRQPLQLLPATPLNKRPATVQLSSSPPSSICIGMKSASLSITKDAEVLTPPVTPVTRTSGRDLILGQNEETNPTRAPKANQDVFGDSAGEAEDTKSTTLRPTRPRLYAGTYTISGEYGRGVWSTVYRAVETSSPPVKPSRTLTPPTSPSTIPQACSSSILLAIKTPVSPSAHPVLLQEALVLTYLHSYPGALTYIVPFHGLHTPTSSLVLSALPLTLEIHAQRASTTMRANFSTATMFDPVIGTAQWLELAEALVGGLAWLQSRHVIHGDIKPANILLRPVDSEPNALGASTKPAFSPLYADFSSSFLSLPSTIPRQPAPTDAITPAFTAPELLAGYFPLSKAASHPNTPPLSVTSTFASDVFALGVTLIVAAIGESPYPGRSEMQRLAMAREGRPLGFARGGEQASRVMRGGVVDRGIRGAVEEVGRRWGVGQWRELLEEIGDGDSQH